MSTDVEFSRKFQKLLDRVPKGVTLEEWQYLYRQVIFKMGERILEGFQDSAIGPNPFPVRGGRGEGGKGPKAPGGGPVYGIHGKGGGGGPHLVVCLANCVLDLSERGERMRIMSDSD